MRPDKNFKMKSTIKTVLTLMKGSKDDKAHWKRAMIDAQLCEEAAQRSALKSKDKDILESKKSAISE